MKLLFLVEGQNDIDFISECAKTSTKIRTVQVGKFFNSGNKDKKRQTETSILRNFSEESSPYKAFVKGEQGKPNVISLFESVVVNFIMSMWEIYLIVMFDHDHSHPDEEIKNIFSNMTSRNRLLKFDLIGKQIVIEGLCRRDYKIFKTTSNSTKCLGKFSFLTFDTSLEATARNMCRTDPIDVCINALASKVDFDRMTTI